LAESLTRFRFALPRRVSSVETRGSSRQIMSGVAFWPKPFELEWVS
jgi:hypothetical protein